MIRREPARILVVDDDAIGLDMLCRRLAFRGYHCDRAADGGSALAQVAAHDYDAVLLDIMLPDIGGLEVLETIRRDPARRSLPIVMVTVRDDPEDVVGALERGASDYVAKPIDIDILCARLAIQVRLRRSERELKEANERLEARVAERTRKLADTTRDLETRAGELDTVIENVSDVLLVANVDGIVVRCNSRVRDVLGYAPSQVIGQPVAMLIPALKTEPRGAVLERFFEADAHSGYGPRLREIDARTRGGELLPTEFYVSKLAVDDEALLLVSLRDISERRDSQRALVLRDQAIEATGLGLVITRPIADDCAVLDVNRAFELMTGYDREELLGRNPRFLQGPGDDETGEKEREKLRLAIKNGYSTRALLRNFRKDGTGFWNEISIAPVFDESRRPGRWVGVVRDVTERVDTEEKLRLMADALPVMLAYFDRHGRAQMVNHTAESWLGRATHEIVGRSAGEIMGEEVAGAYRHHVEMAGMRNECVFVSELVYPDGVARTVEVHHIPQLDFGGSLAGYYTMATDITERERARAQLVQSQRLESIGQLSGGIAHDFNNLLSIIQGNLQLLLRNPSIDADTHARRRLHSAIDAVTRGADLTQRLLAFSRRQRLQNAVVDVTARLLEMNELLRRAVGELIDIETRLADDLRTIEVDPSQFENAILNLVVNARDAMPGGGRLTIETAHAGLDEHDAAGHPDVAPGDYVMIAVGDNGQGMSAEVREHAFEPFFSTKESGRGTGLGLASVFGYVKQCGGHVSLDSEPGVGTTVRLYFPVSRSGNAVRTAHGNGGAEPVVHGDETILVVDDNADVRDAVAELLRTLGYEVLEAENGPDALRVLAQSPSVALLFTDMVMPGGMSGVELAERAREAHPGLKVLYTSGYADGVVQRDGSPIDAGDWIQKPADIDRLGARIRQLMDADGQIRSTSRNR